MMIPAPDFIHTSVSEGHLFCLRHDGSSVQFGCSFWDTAKLREGPKESCSMESLTSNLQIGHSALEDSK